MCVCECVCVCVSFTIVKGERAGVYIRGGHEREKENVNLQRSLRVCVLELV